jgi:hypothetical protein
VVAAIVVVIFVRAPMLYLRPFLHAEDGLLFQYYYSHRAVADVWREYAGYVSMLPNTLAWLALGLPVRAVPHVFAALAGLCVALAFSSVMLARTLFPSVAVRAVVAVGVAAMPLATFAEVSMLADCSWSLVIAAALVSVSTPDDATVLRQAAGAALRVLAFLTQPIALVFVAFDLVALVRRRFAGWAVHLPVLIMAAVVKLRWVAPPVAPTGATAAKLLTVGLLERVASEALLGGRLRWWIHERLPAALPVLGLTMIVLLGWIAWRIRPHGEQRRQLLWLAALVLLVQLAVVLGRGAVWDLLSPFEHRYFYIQKVLFLVLAAGLVSAWPAMNEHRRLAGAMVFAVVVSANWVDRHDYGNPGFVLEADQVARFTDRLAALEAEHGGRRGFEATLERATTLSGMWPISVDVRSR